MFFLFGCAPTRVKKYSRETPLEKTIPEEASSERISKEKTAPVRTTPEKTYVETVFEWKSYQDLVKWMENDFSFDRRRYEEFKGTLPVPRTPQETFRLRSGIYIDAAFFLKEALNRINPSYDARIVVLIFRPYGFNHYVCSFKAGGKLFILDYGTPYREVTGVHGPYHSLEEYKIFYKKYNPIKREIEAITHLQ
jgi:hypothetical protein